MFVLKIALLFSTFVLPFAHGFGRIVGGFETTIEKRPYQASLQLSSNGYFPYCGAAIISTKYLLTAAQCDPKENFKSLYVRIGSTSYYEGGQFFKVAEFTPHPLFNSTTLDYDFAIVSIGSSPEIELGPAAAVIPMASAAALVEGSSVTVSGWGIVWESASAIPGNLREVDMPAVRQDVCKSTYDYLSERQLCLGGTPEGMISACLFDTGGPAVQNGLLFGLVSGFEGCGRPNVPGIFSRVASVRDWIFSHTGV